MKVKFLRNLDVPISTMRYCGDGCCSWTEWTSHYACAGDEEEVAEHSSLCLSGMVDISSLKFNEDYIIIEYP